MKNFPDLAIGSIVYGVAGKTARVLSIEGDRITIDTTAGVRVISLAKVARAEPPEALTFSIGSRVTLADKYQVRAADTGTVEAFTPLGIQVWWDNNSPQEQLKELPPMQRTYQSDELELIERGHTDESFAA
jgi:hypothetical protein